jgi:CheY-like chemotaxis protein
MVLVTDAARLRVPPGKMGKMNSTDVLVVDDDTDIRESISHLLEYEGYKVSTAGNGVEGFQRLLLERPSLILLDLMMPVMDGWQFKMEFDTRPDLVGIPIVVVSADGNIAEKSNSIGIKEFLTKPIDIDTLLGLVKKYCSPSPSPSKSPLSTPVSPP